MAAGREKFLRVAEAKPADAGRGIVRIDPEVMKILELKEGDIALIECTKSTAAGVRRGYPEDANRGVIRMDGMQRLNAGVFFFQAEDGIRDVAVTGVQTCALPISTRQLLRRRRRRAVDL